MDQEGCFGSGFVSLRYLQDVLRVALLRGKTAPDVLRVSVSGCFGHAASWSLRALGACFWLFQNASDIGLWVASELLALVRLLRVNARAVSGIAVSGEIWMFRLWH